MTDRRRVDLVTIVGLGLLLMPLTTMWHEIGGHVVACVVQGGNVTALGAFYVDCAGLGRGGNVVVALAGAAMDAVAAALAFQGWRRARGDMTRLVLWLIWVSKGFVAAGYLCFSGGTGLGDLGPGTQGGIGPLPWPAAWRLGEFVVGVALYGWLVRKAIATMSDMIGDAAATGPVRRRIAHGYYIAAGVAAVLVGLLNPVGLFVTLASAAASSFGGLAGFISIGFAVPRGEREVAFVVPRSWPILAGGGIATAAFAWTLGPTLRF